MKKWENHLGNAIYLSDTEEEVNKKIMSAVTDPARIKKKDDPGNPNMCMVAYYHKLFSTTEEVKQCVCEECKLGKRGCVACKNN